MFKKQLILIISVTAGAAAVLGTLIIFLSSSISQKTAEIEVLEDNLNFRLQATDSLVVLRGDYSKAQQYIPTLDTILPTRDQLVSFPRDLSNSAKQEKINLNVSLGEETPKTETKLGSIAFTATGQGKFDGFINFFKGAETGRYSIKLDTLDFTRQGEDFRALIKGKVFSF
jgi:type II secretory pathway pseudopilin PulG